MELFLSYIFQFIMIFKGILKIHQELTEAFCKEWLEKPQTATNSRKNKRTWWAEVTQIPERFISRLPVKLEIPDYGQDIPIHTHLWIRSYSDLNRATEWSCTHWPKLPPLSPTHPFTRRISIRQENRAFRGKNHTNKPTSGFKAWNHAASLNPCPLGKLLFQGLFACFESKADWVDTGLYTEHSLYGPQSAHARPRAGTGLLIKMTSWKQRE